MRTELGPGRCAVGRISPLPGVQAFDGRRQLIVRPDEIWVGDWLRDLGTLRQVVSVDEASTVASLGPAVVVRFASVPGVEDLALSIPGAVAVTVWRMA